MVKTQSTITLKQLVCSVSGDLLVSQSTSLWAVLKGWMERKEQ